MVLEMGNYKFDFMGKDIVKYRCSKNWIKLFLYYIMYEIEMIFVF